MMADDEERPARRFNTRPESTIAQNFAADLDSMFGLKFDDAVESLARTVDEKRQTVTSGEQQLQELEAKLRETEERLARVSRHSSPSRPANPAIQPAQVENKQAADGAPKPSPLAQRPLYPADRPPTSGERPAAERGDTQALMSNMPGSMPSGTPQHNGAGDYVMVSSGGGRGYE